MIDCKIAMSIYIRLSSGIGNRLLPLISAMKIADEKNVDLIICWCQTGVARFEGEHVKKWSGKLHKFQDFFKGLESVKIIQGRETFNATRDISAYKILKNEITINRRIKNKNLCIDRCWNLFDIKFYGSDLLPTSIKRYNHPLNTKSIIHENEFTQKLRFYLKKIKPNHEIQSKIDSIYKQYFPNQKDNDNNKVKILSVHARSTDGGFGQINFESLKNRIDHYIAHHDITHIYFASDNPQLQQKYNELYRNYIIKVPDAEFNNKRITNNFEGIKNGIIEMYLLSKCDYFIGTHSSTFSLLAWLLSDLDRYEVFGI